MNFEATDYVVVEKPSMETWMQGGVDYIVFKRLDIDGIHIIGSVLVQSIALDHFVRHVFFNCPVSVLLMQYLHVFIACF